MENNPIELRLATFEDWPLLLEWRNDEETRKNSHTTEIVSKEAHTNWLKGILANPERIIYIATYDKKAIGTVRTDFNNETYTLSWTIAPEARGKGLGKLMVKTLSDRLKAPIIAEVKKGNLSSAKIAEFAGLKLLREENGIQIYARN